jgi:ADP-heptose:LPS heptosyltransferase
VITVPAGFPREESPREIVIVKPSSLGDVVHTLPAVACVRRAWPEARIRWVINPEWAPLLEGNPDINEVVIFPRGEFRGSRGVTRLLPWIQRMQREVQADLVLDFQGLLRSALVAKLCCRVRGKIAGLSDAREGAGLVYHHTAEVSGEMHAVDRYLKLVETLGVTVLEPLLWRLPEGSCPAGFTPPERFILLHPFSRGAGKSLNVEDVREFCESIAPRQVVIAGRTDVALPPMANAIDLLNRTSLQELIWLIRQAQFVVSVDSGPMHIAAALTADLLAIHTWSDPEKVGPYRRDAWIWKDAGIFQRTAPAAIRPAPGLASLAQFVATRLTS